MLDWNIDSTWTLFLDRDGVINERKMGGYIENTDELTLLKGVPEAIADFTSLFSNIFVVTNQQGISKKIMTACNLIEIHSYIDDILGKSGGKITKYYFAPELKSDPHSTRKPLPFMGLKAKEEFPEVNFEKSVMIGDTDSDILFGKNLGMKTVRIKTIEPIKIEADYTCFSLMEFSKQIAHL